jgi:hypothetical protein
LHSTTPNPGCLLMSARYMLLCLCSYAMSESMEGLEYYLNIAAEVCAHIPER